MLYGRHRRILGDWLLDCGLARVGASELWVWVRVGGCVCDGVVVVAMAAVVWTSIARHLRHVAALASEILADPDGTEECGRRLCTPARWGQ